MKSENVISWNVPNFISICLMLALLWCGLGVVSHLLFRKGRGSNAGQGVAADSMGNVVQMA